MIKLSLKSFVVALTLFVSTAHASEGAQDNFMSINGGVYNTSSSPAVFLGGGYGWNLGHWEYGVNGSISYFSSDFGGSIGGQLDYNFVKNDGSHDWVYGPSLDVVYFFADSFTSIGAGFVLKYFPFETTPAAIRLNSTFNTNISDGTTDTYWQILGVGLQVYF